MSPMKLYAAPIMAFLILALAQMGYGQEGLAPSPAAQGPSSNDGAAIDQGIAYLLLLLALGITYLIH